MTTECYGNGVMTPVIWMVTWLLHAVMCDLPAPVNVTLSSSHFVHQLRWDPGPGSPRDVYYCVRVFSRSWEVVAGCEHVESPLMCNLTKAFSSRTQTYYSQVFAVLGNQVSPSVNTTGFIPFDDTHLDPPLVSVRACGSTLCVGLRPPVDGLWDVYDKFRYKFNISSSSKHGATFPVEKESLKEEILKDLAPGREYCVSVRIIGRKETLTKNPSYSKPDCAFTTAKYSADTEISLVLCLLVLSGLGTALLVRTGFICLRQPLPEILRLIQHMDNLHPVPYVELFSSMHGVLPSSPSGSTGKDGEIEGESEEESEAETEGERSSEGGQGYKTRGITARLTYHNPLSSSSSSSSSRTEVFPHSPTYPTDIQTTAESNHPHVPLFITSDQQPESLLRPDCLSMSLSNNHPRSRPSQTSQLPEPAQCVSRIQDFSISLSSERDTGNVEGFHPEEEEGSCLGVNLLSVTLGRHEELKRQREMMEPETLSLGEFLPSDTECWATEPVATQTHTATSEVEEEEDEEYSDYMRR